MDVEAPRGLLRFFDELEDPRMERTKLHSLSDILFITLCAVHLRGGQLDGSGGVRPRQTEWLKTFLALPNGIPSHDTFGRVFAGWTRSSWNDASRTGWRPWPRSATAG